jgi:ABC-2 type transport system ATP-binding protein
MGQRLGIAAALLGDPPVVILDEPVNGLDPNGVLWVRTLARSLAAQGRTVFLSSHLLGEVALTADRLVILGRGRLLAQTTVDELLAGGRHVVVRSPDVEKLSTALRRLGAEVEHVDRDSIHVRGTTSDAIGDVARAGGLHLTELSTTNVTLEQRYLELTGDSLDYRATTLPTQEAV